MDYGPYFGGPATAGMRVITTVPPAVEPVTLAEAKLWARVENPDEDGLMSDLIVAARERVEVDLKRALITQTKTLFLGGFPSAWSQIQLPYPPLQSVVSVAYTGMAGMPFTADPSSYIFAVGSSPGRVWLPLGSVWPITAPFPDSVQITYVCGYGDTAAAVPMTIRLAMRALIAANYLYRESHQVIQGGTLASTPMYEDFIRSESFGAYG